MESKDWGRVEALFHAALPLGGAARAAYLARECSGEDSLRREVESLVVAYERRADFLEEPAFSLGMRVLSEEGDETLTGKTVGPYRILRELGRGGMGEVYLAEDGLLGRKVALKFLSPGLLNDKWARRQLVKEAKAVAMLDHQNICAVHGMEASDGRDFIVMQYVEGMPLTELIERESPDFKRRLRLAVQIVSAVAEAHTHGIIHRDIKPQNIMVTPGGQVKVLDFGLAKIVKQQTQHTGGHVSDFSQLGLIPGTVAYMSPEQLRAERLDFRSDIFSCGTVLYELFGGSHPFARGSKAETISSVLNDNPPPLAEIPSGIASHLNRILKRCLEKDRAARYPSSSELLYELEELQAAKSPRPWPRVRVSRWVMTALVAAVVVSVAAWFLYLRAARVHTLAVLPIENESPDRSIDYLGDGLAESLINKLSPLSTLRVKAFTAISGYRGKSADPRAVGRELGVEALLVGKIVQGEDSLILQTRLVRAADGAELWLGEKKLRLTEIFNLQDDLARNVTNSLDLWLGSERSLLSVRGTNNPEAFRQYILGMHYWRNRSVENIAKALEHFGEAVKLDPGYARAYAGLADCYALSNITAYGTMSTQDAMTSAKAAAQKSLSLDQKLAAAHAALGGVSLRYDWNWDEAEKEFKRAIELDPDYAPAHYSYSNLLVVTGRMDEAISESATARNLDPFSVTSNMNYCRAFSFARRYGEAEDCFNRLLQEHPDYEVGRYMLGFVYELTGREQEALEIFQKLYATNRRLAAAALGYALGRAGRRAEAQKVLADMEEMSKEKPLPPQEFAVVYIGLGDKDRAFAWLEKAYDDHFASVTYLTAEAAFDSLRPDPRFAELARRINVPVRNP
jgi:serine/threonine-protein kinase